MTANAAREAARTEDGQFGHQYRTSPGDVDHWAGLTDPDGEPMSEADVALWQSAIPDQADAQSWAGYRFGPSRARSWAQHGFTPSVAVMWRAHFQPATAAAWARSRFTPKSATAYTAFGFTPKTASDWRRDGGPEMHPEPVGETAPPDVAVDVVERHRWASVIDLVDPTKDVPVQRRPGR